MRKAFWDKAAGETGYRRFGGKAGIPEFTELPWIIIQGYPLYYPI